MSIVVKSTEQLIMILRMDLNFRGGTWQGSIEIDGNKDYTYADILKLANDQPETIVKVLKVGQFIVDNITYEVLDYAEAQDA